MLRYIQYGTKARIFALFGRKNAKTLALFSRKNARHINAGKLTIVDGSESQTGSIETEPGVSMFVNVGSDNTITINGGTFVATRVTSDIGIFYINGGTFLLPEGGGKGSTMSEYDNVVFGENVVYRDLSGEHDDIKLKNGRLQKGMSVSFRLVF